MVLPSPQISGSHCRFPRMHATNPFTKQGRKEDGPGSSPSQELDKANSTRAAPCSCGSSSTRRSCLLEQRSGADGAATARPPLTVRLRTAPSASKPEDAVQNGPDNPANEGCYDRYTAVRPIRVALARDRQYSMGE